MGRHTVPDRSRWRILVVGLGFRPARVLETCLRKAVSPGGVVSVDYLDRLPHSGLERYATILINAGAPETELERLARAPDLAWRSRAVLDLSACRPESVWRQLHSGTLAAVAFGVHGEEHRLQADLTRLLLADPVLKHLDPILANVCSHPQRAFVIAFLRCTGVTTPQDVAGDLARAPRSLSRDCAALGLSPPQVLVKVSRIARGLTLTVLHQLTINAAARIAGYRHSSSFRKAARTTFGVAVSGLLCDWNDANALERSFRRVLFRRD